VRDGIPCRFIEPSSTLHPLPYRPSNLTDWRDPHNGCMPVPPPPTSLGGHDHWTMAGRRLPPYRSRASPRRKLLHSKALCRRGRGGSNRNCCGLPADIAATAMAVVPEIPRSVSTVHSFEMLWGRRSDVLEKWRKLVAGCFTLLSHATRSARTIQSLR
jgi:hypothetical protein